MARRNIDSDLITYIILAPIFLIIGCISLLISFIENVHAFNLWKAFFISFFLLAIFSIVSYFVYPINPELTISTISIVCLIYLLYWLIRIYSEKLSYRKNIINQVGVTTANCPYCGCSLPKFPQRKTKCKKCGNFIYVRTRPSDKQKILLKKEQVNYLVYNNNSFVIDKSNEMSQILDYLTAHYLDYCNYPQILKIEENDRLALLKYIWHHWDMRINIKETQKQFSKYDDTLLSDLIKIESFRRYTYFQMQEFLELDKDCDEKSLVNLGWMPYEYGLSKGICTIELMPKIFEWWLNKYDNDNFDIYYLQMPHTYFMEEKPDYKIYIFDGTDFELISLNDLKKFCKKNKYGYPYRK